VDNTGNTGTYTAVMSAALRVLSYNVHSLDDDATALASVVRTVAPDLVFVQEGPRRLRWRTRCADLAHSFGMLYAAGGLPSLGNVIMTSHRVRIHETWYLRYPLTPGRHMRGAVFARCSIGRVPFVAVGSHLATDDDERPEQAHLLKSTMAECDAPIVYGGDFNETSGGSAWRMVADGLLDPGAADDVPTFSVANPRRRIDAVLVDPAFQIIKHEVVDSPDVRRASDHFPILLDVALPVLT
jgi:endonuclease/exonuclease/phosphatase family metal-dependent hydrolase